MVYKKVYHNYRKIAIGIGAGRKLKQMLNTFGERTFALSFFTSLFNSLLGGIFSLRPFCSCKANCRSAI